MPAQVVYFAHDFLLMAGDGKKSIFDVYIATQNYNKILGLCPYKGLGLGYNEGTS